MSLPSVGSVRLTRARIPSAWLFAGLAVSYLGLAAYLNAWILTDQVYRSIWNGGSSPAQVEALLDTTRHWERIGYVVGPLALLVRIGLTALLVQLSLLLLGPRARLSHVFRAGMWAQLSLVLATASRALWLTLLPPAARTAEVVQTSPFSLSALLESVSLGPDWELLLGRLSLFDIGWVALFALALEDSGRISLRVATLAVTGAWLFMTACRWAGWLYFTRL